MERNEWHIIKICNMFNRPSDWYQNLSPDDQTSVWAWYTMRAKLPPDMLEMHDCLKWLLIGGELTEVGDYVVISEK